MGLGLGIGPQDHGNAIYAGEGFCQCRSIGNYSHDKIDEMFPSVVSVALDVGVMLDASSSKIQSCI